MVTVHALVPGTPTLPEMTPPKPCLGLCLPFPGDHPPALNTGLYSSAGSLRSGSRMSGGGGHGHSVGLAELLPRLEGSTLQEPIGGGQVIRGLKQWEQTSFCLLLGSQFQKLCINPGVHLPGRVRDGVLDPLVLEKRGALLPPPLSLEVTLGLVGFCPAVLLVAWAGRGVAWPGEDLNPETSLLEPCQH